MHIKDITPLTHWGSYYIHVRLNQLGSTIKDWEDEGLVLNPDFQRGHVWSKSQQFRFVEYVLRGGRINELLFNNKGSFLVSTENFVCVDGLQRLTALLSFMDDQLTVFGGYKKSQIDDIEILCRDITIPIRINSLSTRKQVLQWYLELNEFGTPHTKEELDKVKNLLINC